MAKLITKFKFIQPGGKAGSYLKYIATREGVDKIDDSKALLPVTQKQKDLIAQILQDFPDTKEMHEYDDYKTDLIIGSASEFISRALEDNAQEMMSGKTYADYIATRPRAQRFGSHGLFTDDGEEINLTNVSEELNLHQGNVWTAILSIRREDAARLGFDDGYRWRDMLRTQTEKLSGNLKIPMEHLRWFAAFHNESHHPHVHLIAYSTVENEGYLSKQGLNNLRSSFAKDIFAQDLLHIYKEQTKHRDTLKAESRALMAEIISKINTGVYDNPVVETMLITLAGRLEKITGKKVYGYLKEDVKDLIDSIVDEIAKDERVSALYDLWYQKREEILATYTEKMPDRIPLSKNKEFKSLRNAVIQEALNITAEQVMDEETPDEDIPVSEPQDEEIEAVEPPLPLSDYDRMKQREESGNKWEQYGLSKMFLDRKSELYNPQEAVRWLIKSARQGYTVAQYMLGKLFLKGEDVIKNAEYALRWLEEAVEQNNHYAQYLLGKTFLKGEDVDRDIGRAEKLLSDASAQGNRYAAYTLGKAYLDGTVLLQNIPKAIELLTQSADKGFTPAQYLMGKLLYRGQAIPQNIEKALLYLESAVENENAYAAYLAGKIRLTEEGFKDISKAIHLFRLAAEQGNDYAEYQLGKLYLYGKEVEQDYDQAIRWLTASAEHGNQYAQQLLHSVRSNKNWTAAMGTLRLLHHISRMIQNRLEDDRKGKGGIIIDRKLRRKIEEKNQALGIKQ